MISPGTKPTVLIADDEPAIVRLIRSELELSGYAVLLAADGEAALEVARRGAPDVILLDIMMPGRDGFAVCEAIREFSTAPIIVISARGRERDKVHALNLGADDYMTKPFGVAELSARVRAAVRRARFTVDDRKAIVRAGRIEVDVAARQVTRDGVTVKLTATEYKLLRSLVLNAGRTMPHDALLGAVWGTSYAGQVEYLWVYVGRLRAKLETDPNAPEVIVTVPGVGYRFVAGAGLPEF